MRIVILKGIERNNPPAYRVFVSTNIEPDEHPDSIVMMVGRHNTMTPATTQNLDTFLEMFEVYGRYLLVPAHFVDEKTPPEMGLHVAILKEQLIVKNAWEVSLNDPNAAALTAEDDPLIPPDIKDAPVAALLKAIRERTRGTC